MKSSTSWPFLCVATASLLANHDVNLELHGVDLIYWMYAMVNRCEHLKTSRKEMQSKTNCKNLQKDHESVSFCGLERPEREARVLYLKHSGYCARRI